MSLIVYMIRKPLLVKSIVNKQTSVQEYIDKMTINPDYDVKKTVQAIVPPKELRNPAIKEEDPHGLSSSMAGAKMDCYKPDLDLVLGDFNRALAAVGSVGTFGAAKYSRSGWLAVPNGIPRYSSALLRHFFSSKYEMVDKDSNLLHLSHLAWNALAILELTLRQESDNDKIKKPINKFTEGNSKQG